MNQSICHHISNNDVDIVIDYFRKNKKQILEAELKVKTYDDILSPYDTILGIECVKHKRHDLLKLLHNEGYDLFNFNSEYENAYTTAIFYNDIDTFKFLINLKDPADWINDKGENILFLIVRSSEDQSHFLDLLKDNSNIDFNIHDKYNHPPYFSFNEGSHINNFQWFYNKKYIDNLCVFFENGRSLNHSLFEFACYRNNEAILNFIIDNVKITENNADNIQNTLPFLINSSTKNTVNKYLKKLEYESQEFMTTLPLCLMLTIKKKYENSIINIIANAIYYREQKKLKNIIYQDNMNYYTQIVDLLIKENKDIALINNIITPDNLTVNTDPYYHDEDSISILKTFLLYGNEQHMNFLIKNGFDPILNSSNIDKGLLKDEKIKEKFNKLVDYFMQYHFNNINETYNNIQNKKKRI